MTSLPIVPPSEMGSATKFGESASGRRSEKGSRKESGEDEQFLREAFRSFAETATSLERSYGLLRTEVERLHGELAQTNAGLEQSLEENRAMRQHLDRILNGLPCGVLVAKANGEISLLNPEAQRLLSRVGGAEGAEWNFPSHCEPLPVVPEEIRPLLERARSEAGEQEQRFPDRSFQEQYFDDGGEAECWLAVRHAAVPYPAKADSEKPGGNEKKDAKSQPDPVSIFILRDVSEAKRMVREREKLRRQQALAEMSAILAHEIRNPLGSLELFAGLLADAGLSGESSQWVEQVQAGLRTLAATVNNVLHFHSLPAPNRVPTDLGRLLDWAGGFLLPLARQARVELCLRNRLQGVFFAADRHRLEQVLLNLFLNALRAMPGGGWVEVTGQQIDRGAAGAVSICVSDTGPGIAPGQAAKIFEPGFSTRPGGAGLGLAVCRKIAEQHGGRLDAGNRAGMGACFTLTFPLPEEFRQEVAG